MKYSLVLRTLGSLLLGLSLCLLIPLAVSLYYRDGFAKGEPGAFLKTAVLSAIVGMALRRLHDADLKAMRVREAFVIVPLAWILLAGFGALPFLLTSGCLPSYTDAYFETMSGFTTTGATVLTSIESQPHGILLWRSLCHFLGGMGIIVLSVALFSSYGAAGYQMLKAEVPGYTPDRLTPKIATTAKLLWGIYLLLTGLEIAALCGFGMPAFDAVCHSFSTMATGGFSTKDTNVAFYTDPAIQWTLIVFMFLAGTNFVLHFKLLRGSLGPFLKNSEWKMYTGIILVCGFTFAAILWLHTDIPGLTGVEQVLRDSFFTVISLVTSTGFCTADFDLWPNILRLCLVLLMFCGACSGSTGGGLKCVRFLLAIKLGWREVRRLIHPRLYNPVTLDNQIVEGHTMNSVLGVMILYFLFFGIATLIMSVLIHIGDPATDMETAVSSVVACMSNIGPGLAEVGATKNYAWINIPGKWLLTFCMLLGRLEIYSVVLLLLPSTWRT